jgi:hypothetical protein
MGTRMNVPGVRINNQTSRIFSIIFRTNDSQSFYLEIQ